MDSGTVFGERELILVKIFESCFKEKDYVIFQFVDPQTLGVFTATNIDGDFEIGRRYNCELAFKRNKIVVVAAR